MMKDKSYFRKGHIGRSVFMIMNIFFFSIIMILILGPLLKILSDSFDIVGDYGLNIIPEEPSLAAYKAIISTTSLYRPFVISIITTVVGTTIALLVTTLGAYVLIQKDMPGNKFLTYMIFVTMIFNGGLVPTFLVIKNIGLINSLWAVILPLSLNVYNIILMKSFFEQIPVSLAEAAEIDGCSPIEIFARIVLPLSKPALASIGLFFAVAYWNEFFTFVMYITDTKYYNFQIKLREMILDSTTNMTTGAESIYSATIQNAAVVVAVLPFAIIYPFCQKYFVKGVTVGAVKG